MFSPQKYNSTSNKLKQHLHRNVIGVFGFLFLSLVTFVIATTADAATGINEQISFQGKVVNTNGTNVSNGSYTFLFCLYTTSSPATPCTAGADNDAVWRESKSLTVTDGIFQSNLGDTTTLPGSVDFNTDNIYLGINFNSDGQMTPLVRFTAAPYALNAAKVGGLTVTDTTGTLTIPNGKTIQFADAFTTTGAFPLTLTSTASTTATLPSGTITLVDLATSQSLTNKTIGSTGLTFSGATTDITTATNEDLTIVANGTGTISLNDTVTAVSTVTLSSVANDGAEATALLINGSNQVVSRELGSNAFTSGGFATTALDNLASVAINTSLISDTNNTDDLGSDAIRWRDLFLGSNTLHIGTSTTDEGTVSYDTTGNILNIGTDSTTNGDIAFFTDDLYLDKSTGFVGINDTTPNGLFDFDFSSTSGTNGDEYGANFTVSDTGIVNTGTDNTYGENLSVTRTGATGGTINTYGLNIAVTGDTGGASTATGIAVTASGADFNTGISVVGGAGTGALITSTTGKGLNITRSLTDTTTSSALVDIASIYFYTTGTVTENANDFKLARGVTSTSTGGLTLGTAALFQDNLSLLDGSNTISGTLMSITRNTTNFNPAVTTVSGALLSLSDTSTISGGTYTNTADTFRVVQNYASATGATVNVSNAGAGLALRVNDDGTFTDSTPFVVDASGNVGIGNDTTPVALLTVGASDVFQVNSSGAIAAVVGITNTAGITSTGGIINLNASSNFAVNVATGTSTGAVTIGGGSNTFALDSTALDISTAGAITGATGVTSSGTIIFSGLSSNGFVKTTGGTGTLSVSTSIDLASEVGASILPIANGGTNKALTLAAGGVVWTDADSFEVSAAGTAGQALISGGTTTPTWYAPTAGSVLFAGTNGILEQDNTNFFFDNTNNRLGIGGDTTPDGILDLEYSSSSSSASTVYGSYLTMTDTGAVTSGIDELYGNQITITRSGAGATGIPQSHVTGQYITINNVNAGGSTATSLNYGSSVYVAAAPNGFTENAAFYGSTGGATLNTYGAYLSVTGGDDATGVYAPVTVTSGTGHGGRFVLTDTQTTAATNYGVRGSISDTGIVASGTDTNYGGNFSVTRTGASGGTIDNYGLNVSVTGDTGGTSTNYGAYVNVTGADTNYSGIFTGGNFGIGDVTPTALLTVGASDAFQVASTGGITFNGVTADISTTAGEALTIDSGTTGAINIGTDASAETINIGNTGAAVKTIAIGNNSQANTITIGDASATTVSITDNNWSINASGVASFITGSTIGSQTFTTNNIADSGALTIASATTNALTLDSGTTGTVNLGTGNNAKTINVGTGTAGNTINIGTNNTTLDTINIGSALDDVAITGDQWSITNAGVLTVVSCSGCGGGGATLDSAYTAGNTIGTDSGSNVIINLADVATPTEVTINNLDASGTNALQIDNSTTLTNGLFIEQSAAGTLTNALHIAGTAGTITTGLLIADGAGAITNGIQMTGTFTTTILDTPSIDISGAGAITGATGVSTTTLTSSGTTDLANSGASNVTIATTGTGTVAIGNATGTFALTSSGGLNVTTGGALTGVASIDTIATSATALTFAGAGTISSTTSSSLTLDSGTTGSVLIGTGVAAKTITIGNASDDTFSINSSGLNVTSGGALTGVASIDTISTSATAITFAGTGTLSTGTATDLTINSGTTGTINIGTDASAETINIGNTGAAAKTIAIGNNTQANTITIGDATVTSLSLLENNWGITAAGAGTFGGLITANAGITLAASQIFTASSLSYMDLGAITHGTTAVQGLRLPQAASASPSSPTSGEGYLAWDAGGNQVIYYNGAAWATFSAGGGYNLIQEDGTGLTARTTLNFIGAGITCADNASKTECTLSGGGGEDLQGTYGADADGSNATISLTAADDGLVFTNPTSGGNNLSTFLLQLDQANTTANILALDIVQASNASNAVNLTANAIDGETGLAITTNGLTSGKGISVTSSVAANFTGALASISLSAGTGAASNTGNVLAVSNAGTANANTALFVDHRATGTGNLALRVDDESSDTTPFIIDGHGRVGIGTTAISEDASTERLFQVGSDTNRGNSVTYGEVVSKGQRDLTALTGIKDIFVYDTTSDSDGGRWIDWATTDQLSWYTETLDDGPSDPCVIASDDRCYKASFPRKAILIVTTDSLYIFDAQDNTMWMKFSQNASAYALGVDTSNDPSSVTALNGVIYVGTNGASAGGLYAIDFVNDRMWNYDDTDRSGANVGISGRNAAVTYASDNNTNFDLGGNTGWKTINDVSAASIQWSNTAIAATTGPVNGISFVALATDSGVNLINLSQQRLFQYSRITDDNYESVVITRSARLYALDSTRDELNMWNNVDSDVASQLNAAADKAWDEATSPALTKTTPVIGTGSPDALEVIERASLADGGLTAGTASDLIYIGHDQGLTELHDHATLASGWVKYYNITRQTAMLPAATRRAHMMDDASGDVTNQSVGTDVMVAKNAPTYDISGVRGKAMSFNGTDEYLCSGAGGVCANDASDNLSTGSWTISAWFKHSTTIAGTDVLFSRCYNTTPAAAAGCVAISMPSTGVMTVNVDYDATFTIGVTGTTVFHTSTQTFNDNQWHFIMVTRAATTGNINTMIDGKPIGQNAGLNTTLDAAQIMSLGADCSVGAACATGANFWDGSIDDFVYNANGSTGTTDNIAVTAMRRVYNDARPLVNKKVITVTNATSATSTTITDTGEAWIPNEFAGQVMAITADTGAGQTRRVISNTTDTLTVSPAFTTTPDTTSDFEVDPEAMYGASNVVTSIGITAESPLGEARQMCVGTNSTTDTGGVTCYNHQAGPNLIADVFHGDSEQMDNSGTEWTGTDYDDIRSIDLSGRALIIGSEAHFWTETEDVRLGQGLDYLANQLFNIRQELVNDAITAQGSVGVEVGFTGGADLAERYYSNEALQAGEVVAIDASIEARVKKTSGAYQRDAIGIVATTPGIILGSEAENSYPIALVGRVPVKVTNENGAIYAGDRVTTASRSGYAMRATQAGRVIGQTLADAVDWTVCESEDPLNHDAVLCTTVLVFVNLTDYSGVPVELAMSRMNADETADQAVNDGLETDSSDEALTTVGATIRLATAEPTREERILAYLKQIRDADAIAGNVSSEVFTGRVSASTEVITPTLYADQIFAKSIKADSIEGLSIWTDQISSLSEKYAGLASAQTATGVDGTSAPTELVEQKTLAIAMKSLSADTITVQLDGSILGKLTVAGALRIGGDAEFAGNTIFAKLATFLDKTLFKGEVAFERAPTFSSNTAGFAIIAEGSQSVDIAFDEEYAHQPIVSVSITSDESVLAGEAKQDTQLAQDVAAVEADFAAAYFGGDVKYIVTKKSERGFTIVLNKPAPRELQFSWVAIAVADARVSRSLEAEPVVEPVVEDTPPVTTPVIPPVVTPTEPTPTSVVPAETTPVVDTSPVIDPPADTTPVESPEVPSDLAP